jgi:hypothetical protein
MAKHNRASNLGNFLHPKKSGGGKAAAKPTPKTAALKIAPRAAAGKPISVGAFDLGQRKKSLPK